MILFHVDLDNTLIYSYRHPIGPKKRTAEIYQGREISFLTERTQELLRKLQPYVQIIPTTTRTAEQYARIELGIGKIPYALVCNGGQLLIDGKSDDAWYRQSIRLVQESQTELETAVQMLEAEKSRTGECGRCACADPGAVSGIVKAYQSFVCRPASGPQFCREIHGGGAFAKQFDCGNGQTQ